MMNSKRIEEIQKACAYPESRSVQQALLKVWNECAQEAAGTKGVADVLAERRRQVEVEGWAPEHDDEYSHGEMAAAAAAYAAVCSDADSCAWAAASSAPS